VFLSPDSDVVRVCVYQLLQALDLALANLDKIISPAGEKSAERETVEGVLNVVCFLFQRVLENNTGLAVVCGACLGVRMYVVYIYSCYEHVHQLVLVLQEHLQAISSSSRCRKSRSIMRKGAAGGHATVEDKLLMQEATATTDLCLSKWLTTPTHQIYSLKHTPEAF